MDEFELVQWEVAKNLHETEQARAQLLLGSTRFRTKGPMDRLINEKGQVFKMVRWCIWDAMARCHRDCLNVNEPGFSGQCPLYAREEVMADGTVETVPMCHGKAHQADGHLSWAEVVSMYLMSDPTTWGVIMELKKPGSEGLFFPELDETPEGRHVRSEYEYAPGREVYLAYDDGFAWPACLGAWQVRADGLVYQFDELYGREWLPSQILEEIARRPWVDDVVMGLRPGNLRTCRVGLLLRETAPGATRGSRSVTAARFHAARHGRVRLAVTDGSPGAPPATTARRWTAPFREPATNRSRDAAAAHVV